MNDKIELLPCPFCGCTARYVPDDYVDNSGRAWPFAECGACNTGAPVEFWNRRTAPAAPVAWVRVIDGEPMKYSWFGSKRLPAGKHYLYAAPPAAEQPGTVKMPSELLPGGAWDAIETLVWQAFEYGAKDYKGCVRQGLRELRALLAGGAKP